MRRSFTEDSRPQRQPESASSPAWLTRECTILLAYTAIAILATYPLAIKLGHNWLPYDSDDLWLKLWDIWYVRELRATGSSITWTRLLFYPYGLNIALHSINWVSAVLAQPAAALFGISTAYNLSILGGIVANAYCAYRLIARRVAHRGAAFFGGLIFTAGPYTIAHAWSHPDHTRMWSIPLCILLIVLALEEKSYWAAVGAGIAYGLAAWSSLYLFGFLSLTLAPVVAFTLLRDGRWRERRTWPVLGATILVAMLTVGSRLYPVMTSDLGYAVESKYDSDHQTDLLAYVVPTANPLLRPLIARALPQLVAGVRWSPYLGWIPLVMVFLALAVERRHPERWMWASVALIFLVLAAGDTLRFNGQVLGRIALPARWLQGISLFRAVRPNLYHTGLLLPVAVLAAMGLDGMLGGWPGHRYGAIGGVAMLSALVLAGYWRGPAPMQRIDPHPYLVTLGADADAHAVIDVPMGYFPAKLNLYRQTLHQHPTAGGFAGRLPPGADRYIEDNLLLRGLARGEPLACDAVDSFALAEAVDGLVADGFRYVLVHDVAAGWPATYFGEIPTTYRDDALVVYDLRLLAETPPCASDLRPLPEAEAAPLLAIPSPEGLPCGVFDVRGQGEKRIELSHFPGCGPAGGAYAVRCLNGEGQWVGDTVFDLSQGGGVLSFTSGQHGTCAIVPLTAGDN